MDLIQPLDCGSSGTTAPTRYAHHAIAQGVLAEGIRDISHDGRRTAEPSTKVVTMVGKLRPLRLGRALEVPQPWV